MVGLASYLFLIKLYHSNISLARNLFASNAFHNFCRLKLMKNSFGERSELTEQSIVTEAIKNGIYSFPVGIAGSLARGFWFAQPSSIVYQNMGRLSLTFGLAGAAYKGSATLVAHARETNDSFNEAFGGFIAGSLFGLVQKTIVHSMLYGGISAVAMYGITEALATNYKYRSKPVDSSRRLKGFLSVQQDPFANRIKTVQASE